MARCRGASRRLRPHARMNALHRDLGDLHSAPAVEPVPQREGEPKPEMNGVKKSDRAILPSKRANKGTGVPAEPVEGRASAKENPRSESTRRTQSRESVTQAAGRIRQAATRKPQEKLTALLHHVTPDALRWAFHALKRDAAAGVDDMTWALYAEGLEERLLDLHRRVQSGAYRVLPVRRVEIPKPDGELLSKVGDAGFRRRVRLAFLRP